MEAKGCPRDVRKNVKKIYLNFEEMLVSPSENQRFCRCGLRVWSGKSPEIVLQSESNYQKESHASKTSSKASKRDARASQEQPRSGP